MFLNEENAPVVQEFNRIQRLLIGIEIGKPNGCIRLLCPVVTTQP